MGVQEGAGDRRFTRRRAVQGAIVSALTYQLAGSVGVAEAQSDTDPDGSAVSSDAPILGASGDFVRLADESPEQLAATLTSFAAAGASAVRFPVDWSELQPKLGQFNWGLLEPLYRELLWSGLKAIPVIVNTGPDGLNRFEDDRTGITDIQDPLQSLALALSGFLSSYGPQLGGIEVWSEPNGPDVETTLRAGELQRAVGSVAEVGVGFGNDVEASAISGGLAVDEAGTWTRYLPRLATLGDGIEVALHIPPPDSLDDSVLRSHYLEPIDQAIGADIARVWVCTAAPDGLSMQDVAALVGGWEQVVTHPGCAGFLVHSDLGEQGLIASFDASLTGGEPLSPDSPALAAAQAMWEA